MIGQRATSRSRRAGWGHALDYVVLGAEAEEAMIERHSGRSEFRVAACGWKKN